MSGSQGRFPPAVPPPQWRPQADGERTGHPAHGQSQRDYPQQGHPQQVQPQLGQPQQWAAPPQPQSASAPFPPQFQPQAPASAGASQHGRPQQLPPPVPQPAPGQLGWAPGQQPAFPPQMPPQQQYGQAPQSAVPPQQQAGGDADSWRRNPDPSAYDLGSYAMPSGQPPAPQQGQRPARPEMAPQWSPQPIESYPYPSQGSAGPASAPQQPGGYAYPPQQATNAPALQHEQDPAYDEVEYDEPPKRGRRWLIAAALVGSIALGGGMAYGYKMMFASKSTDRTAVLKAPRDPAKVAPTERGGKQIANTDSRLLNDRLPGSGSAPGGSASETDSNGVRKVTVVPVGTNRETLPSGNSGPPSVPGVTLVGGANNSPFPSPGATTPVAQQPQQRVAAATPPPPRQPVVKSAPLDAADVTPPPAKAKQVIARDPAVPAEPRAKPTGYVAVLGFQRSQLEAMKMMADLQQKYDALRDRKLDIVQSDQTSRGLGVIYRVVVGPRGGIGPVREVCSQLKQAGMADSGCYPLAD